MTYNEISDKKKYQDIFKQVEDEHSKNDKLVNINDKVLIIDFLNTFIRSFSANPAINDDGVHIGGIIGFLKSIRYTLARIKPTRCIIVFDGKGGAKKRQKIYPEYKHKRKVKHKLNRNVDWGTVALDEKQSMAMQVNRLVLYLERLPLTLISIDGTEADDVIAYIAKQLLTDSKIIISSTDKDFYQLINDRINIWSPIKKIEYTKEKIFEEYGIPAHNFLTYRILEGDISDNIKGIKGAGLISIKKYINPITEQENFDIKQLIKYANDTDKKYQIIKNIKNNTFLLKRNYVLMQLLNVDLSNHNKLYIQESIRKEIPQLIKYKFSTMFIQDKLWSQIPDMNLWITEFIRLDHINKDTND